MVKIQPTEDISDLPLIQPEMWGTRTTERVPSMKRAVMKIFSKSGRGSAMFGKGTRGGNSARGPDENIAAFLPRRTSVFPKRTGIKSAHY